MATPVEMTSQIGYVTGQDIYVSFTEYYGDDTIYGRRDVVDANGNQIKGSGKSKKDLIAMGAMIAEEMIGTVNGWLVGVPDDAAEAPAEAPVEAPAEAPVEKKTHTVKLVLSGFEVTYTNVLSYEIL